MTRARVLLTLLLVAGALVPATTAAATPYAGAPGCPDQPADSWWHADISALPVHPRSTTYVASMGAARGFHADFGSGLWDGGPIGIPFTTVPGNQPRVPVTFGYASESDPGPYPIPANAPIEGGPNADGDRHVLVVDRDACVLYELYDAHRNPDGSWRAGSGARWDLRSNQLRPAGWTSADAAGLPILPGLVRYDEVASGSIDHALRVTARATQNTFVWPATHQAGVADPDLPPMGLRLRLKANVDLSGLPPHARVIAAAMQRYGLVVADSGSSWYVSGAPDERWDNDVLHALDFLRGSDFEAVDASSLMVSPTSGQVRAVRSDAELGRFVACAYRDLLGRGADAAGRAAWVAQLARRLPPATFTAAVARSNEGYAAWLRAAYELALDRLPDAAGLAGWRARLQAGTPTWAVLADLFGSGEAYAKAGATPEALVDRLYRRLLGRGPDPAGLAGWSRALRAGTPRSAVALGLLQSAESRRRRVTGAYLHLLGRQPDSVGLAGWSALLEHHDDLALAIALTSSPEYVSRAQTRSC